VTNIKAPSISSIIGGQIGAEILLALIGFGLSGIQTALSLGLGGLICFVANTVFTLKAFKYRGASATEQIVKEFVSGEVYKILLSAVGFALTFNYVPAATPLLVFLGYIAVYLVGMVSTMHVVRTYNQAGI
jgi:ATP synthase protein I